MRKAAAVVIGVNNTGGLVPLASAADGAERLATWLESDGYDVTCLTDRTAPVTRTDIEQAIRKYVTLPARYEFLLVYFSGHGYWAARNDTWLLSGAPSEPDEAVNLFSATERAKYTGIPNIVFISDACRSIPDSRTASSIEGTGLFPTFRDVNRASKIDSFKATLEATSAWEGMIDGRKQSVLTAALLSALQHPEPTMISELPVGGQTLKVIPNRRLEDYLQRKVDEFLAEIDPLLVQDLDINVPSSDSVYIATVRPMQHASRPDTAPTPVNPPMGLPGGPPPSGASPGDAGGVSRSPAERATPVPSARRRSRQRVGREAAAAVSGMLSTSGFGGAMAMDAMILDDPAAADAVRERKPVDDLTHYESKCGFTVRGAVIEAATTSQFGGTALLEILHHGAPDGTAGLLRIWTEALGSCAIRFTDGRSTVVAVLPGYIGHIVVGPDGIRNVSYIPSNNTERFAGYAPQGNELDQFRAIVSVAAERNRFEIGNARAADTLASRIRFGDSIDPALGLYASLAFLRAGSEMEQAKVMLTMREDLGADLYDLRVFADRLPVGRTEGIPIVPFCPMLTETWNLLVSHETPLSPTLRRMRGHLANALWTTFTPGVADDIFSAIDSGEYR